MRKLKLYAALIAVLLLLLLIINMKNISKYLIYAAIAIGGIAIGWAVQSIFFCKDKTETVYVPGEIQLKDTCLTNNLLCTLTYDDSVTIYRIVREGLKKHVPNEKPAIGSVTVDSSTVVPTVTKVFYKLLSNGTLTVWDTVTVKGQGQVEIVKWDRAYKLDEVETVKETVKNNTAIIEKGDDQTEKIKYLPVEISKKQTWVGLESGILWYNEPVVPIGITLQSGKSTFAVQKDVLTPFGKLEGYGIKYSRNLIKVSTK